MNFNTQEALVGIILGVCIILVIGTGMHLIQHSMYNDCVSSVASHMYNISNSPMICDKPGWWLGI